MVSDNGPHFSSALYHEFATEWGFNHQTTSPRRPQGNGFIERQIRTIKTILKKAKQSRTTPEIALLHWRCTPISNAIPSPAQLLMGRRIQSPIATKIENNHQDQDQIYDAFKQRQHKQKKYFDQHALKEDLPPLYPGQRVRAQNPTHGNWDLATVASQTDGPRSYLLQTANGYMIRRNRQHIRSAPIRPTPPQTPKHVTFAEPPACTTQSPQRDSQQYTRSGRMVRPPSKMNL